MEKRIFAGGTPDWEPPCDEWTYTAEIEVCERRVKDGEFPELENGFCFVFDPVEHEDHYFSGIIPAEQYAWHFAMRQVPVALPHTSIHSHDITHMPSYQRMFRHALYADIVQLAAFNSLGNPERCAQFTDVQDHFADQMIFLHRDDGFNQIANFTRIRRYLNTLVELAYLNSGYEGEELQLHRDAAFEELATLFEFAEYENWYDRLDERYEIL